MVSANGNNLFNGCFDFFEWSAPYYENPQEVLHRLLPVAAKGRIIKSIRVIGLADDIGITNNGLLYQRIKDAGNDPGDNWMNTYPNLDSIQVPWEVKACEPVQLVFDDGNTLEILPIEKGGARIAENSIPTDISDGLNHSNFDGNLFFSEALGRRLQSVILYVDKHIKQYIEHHTAAGQKPYEEIRTAYRICLRLEYPYEINLVQTWESWYRIQMSGSGWDTQVPYARVKSAQKNVDQIYIVNGRGSGGDFWIVPLCSNESDDEKHVFFDNYGMSIDDYDLHEFLSEFLYKYYDPSIQETDHFDSESVRTFDWYGRNLYSFENMRKMLQDIRGAAELLLSDYDNPKLSAIKSNYSWYRYTSKHKDELTDAEINELRKNQVPIAVDFYLRFVKRMESMMKLPGCDMVSFAGP